MSEKKNNKTKAWEFYEKGRAYNNSLSPNQYDLVNTNWEFYSGNQWLHLPQTAATSRLPKPVFNIIKRSASLLVAEVTSSATTINLDSLSYTDAQNEKDPKSNACEMANAEIQNLLEKFKFDFRLREAMIDGAVSGDYCAHFFWDADARPYGGAFGQYRGEIEMELVDGINVMFGNPNDHRVQKQPYILLIGRDTVDHLNWEKERWGKRDKKSQPKEERDIDVVPDNETQWQAAQGGDREIMQGDDRNDKALYVLLYTKVQKEEKVLDEETGEPIQVPVLDSEGKPKVAKDANGQPILNMDGTPAYETKDATKIVTSVHATKATRNTVIYENIDTGLSLYPVAWGNWERQKNQYHGRALVTGIVPNQISINRAIAMALKHQELMAFPKIVYNQDLIGTWSNEVGQAIGVRNLAPGQAIGDVAQVIQPADMSNQITALIDDIMAYTRECLGITDVQMGKVNPENTSAIMVLSSNTEVPYENPRANMYEWTEDIAAILLDMMGTYYGVRPVVRVREMKEPIMDEKGQPRLDPVTNAFMVNEVRRRVSEPFDFSQLKNLWFNIRVNVGATTTFSEIAMTQTLDNLRREGTLGLIDYLERIPDKLIPKKQELIDKLNAQVAAQGTDQQMIDQNPGLAGAMLGGEIEANQQQMIDPTTQVQPSNPQPTAQGDGQTGEKLDPMKVVQSLPQNIQNKWSQYPAVAQNALYQAQGSG